MSIPPYKRGPLAAGLRRLSVVGLLAVGLLSCAHPSTSGGSTAASSPSPSLETRVVGLGDSVPAAAGCACTSFVELFGHDVGQHTGRSTRTDNYARDGLDTAGLLAQLKDASVAQGVAHADLVTVTIGANDLVTAESDYFARSPRRSTATPPTAPAMSASTWTGRSSRPPPEATPHACSPRTATTPTRPATT
jgi:lysophospholipase L1-like esterase